MWTKNAIVTHQRRPSSDGLNYIVIGIPIFAAIAPMAFVGSYVALPGEAYFFGVRQLTNAVPSSNTEVEAA